MYQHAYEESNFENVYEEIEQYYSKLKAERDLYEAIDMLNSVMDGVSKVNKLKMGELFDEVLLVNITDNSIIRIMQRDEVLAIFNSLKKLLDLQMH